MTSPRVILFDLGGVLVETGGPEEALRHWNASDAMIRYETGMCSREDFARSLIDEWNLGLETAEFLTFFAAWLKPTFPGALELLASLKPRFTLACLSNTNELHWEIMLARDELLRTFDRCFASHQMGLRKPGREIYLNAISSLGCGPSDIVFFDDREDNVVGARAVGMSAHQVHGPAALARTVATLGLV